MQPPNPTDDSSASDAGIQSDPENSGNTPAAGMAPQVMGQTAAANQQLVGQVTAQPMMMGGMPGNVIIVQQPSAAPKVIGILSIIYGVFGVIGSLMLVVGASFFGSLLEEADLGVGSNMLMILAAVGLVTGAGWIVAGVWMNGRQRRGVHLAWLLLMFEFVLDVVISLTGAGTGVESGVLAIGMSVVGTGICGVIVAIPLMISNSGLDDSSLIPK
jgi:hypothetical protein